LSETQTTEAILSLDRAGRFLDANAAALELLGVTLNELIASPADRFAFEPGGETESAERRADWEATGARPLVGSAGIKRADGSPIRVAFAVETTSTGFRARLWPIEGAPEAPPTVFSVDDVLREWRAAERGLAVLEPGTPEWIRTTSEIEMLRGKYQDLFRRVEPGSDEG
jgi:PAS domain S-box-containing protein